MNTPINQGILQSDLDCAGYDLLNFSGGGGGGGSGLDANTVTADDIGLVGDGVTDNTDALQAWLTDVEAAKVNSTLLVPDGIYIFGGVLQDGSRRNAQILLPELPQTGAEYSVTIKGYHAICASGYGSVKGPIFRSTLAVGSGTLPSFIGGRGPSGGIYHEVSPVAICFENMVFQTVQNPQITCINLERYAKVRFTGDVIIMAGTSQDIFDGLVEPTTSTSYGLILPMVDVGLLSEVERVDIFNFYTGVRFGELNHVHNISFLKCMRAMEFTASYHANLIGRVLDWHCAYGVYMTGNSPFQIDQMDIERENVSSWNMRIADVYDPASAAYADITWWTVAGGVGWSDTFTVNGGIHVNAHRLGHPAQVYVGDDMRLTSLSSGGKVQARNPSIDSWADKETWTNP